MAEESTGEIPDSKNERLQELLVEKYFELEDEHIQLQKDYMQHEMMFEQLKEKHSQLIEEHNDLKMQYDKITSKFNQKSLLYSTLKSTYDAILQQNRDDFDEQKKKLEIQNEDLKNQIKTIQDFYAHVLEEAERKESGTIQRARQQPQKKKKQLKNVIEQLQVKSRILEQRSRIQEDTTQIQQKELTELKSTLKIMFEQERSLKASIVKLSEPDNLRITTLEARVKDLENGEFQRNCSVYRAQIYTIALQKISDYLKQLSPQFETQSLDSNIFQFVRNNSEYKTLINEFLKSKKVNLTFPDSFDLLVKQKDSRNTQEHPSIDQLLKNKQFYNCECLNGDNPQVLETYQAMVKLITHTK